MANTDDNDRRKELHREISSYISVRRKKQSKGWGVFSLFKGGKRKSKVDLHPEVKAYGEKHHEEEPKPASAEDGAEMEEEYKSHSRDRSFWGWVKSKIAFEKNPDESLEEAGERAEAEEEKMENEEKTSTEMEKEYKEEAGSGGWLSGIMSKIFVKSREEEELEEASDEIAEEFQDLKAVAEITTKVMKMLPSEKLKELKESEDFRTFKEILKKRNLIK